MLALKVLHHLKFFDVKTIILIICLSVDVSVSVRPIHPEKQARLGKSSESVGLVRSKNENLILESGCPDRCVCYETIVRCMFLSLKKIPEIPKNTTNL